MVSPTSSKMNRCSNMFKNTLASMYEKRCPAQDIYDDHDQKEKMPDCLFLVNKAAAHVAVRPSVLVTVRAMNNIKSIWKSYTMYITTS